MIPDTIPLVYGGSVNEINIADIVKIPELDGVLVGNASLDPKTFADIIGASWSRGRKRNYIALLNIFMKYTDISKQRNMLEKEPNN